MSQSKTVIQGITPNEGMGGMADMYARGNQAAATRGTVVPGMENMANGMGTAANNINTTSRWQPQHTKPVVGFLYSISRSPMGEYWPLQIGRNTIGQDAASDIVLKEGTVSGNHAVIVVRQIKNTGGVIAAITDTQSTNGTMINGETIGFQAVECHDGDVITIGNNYKLFLVLIDANKHQLSVSKDFIPVSADAAEADNNNDIPPFDMPSMGGTQPEGFGAWSGGGIDNNGTVGLDGSATGYNNGGTIPM